MWNPQDDFSIRLTDKTAEPRSEAELKDMIAQVNEVVKKHGFKIRGWGSWQDTKQVAIEEQQLMNRHSPPKSDPLLALHEGLVCAENYAVGPRRDLVVLNVRLEDSRLLFDLEDQSECITYMVSAASVVPINCKDVEQVTTVVRECKPANGTPPEVF